jgi:FAD binding domain
MPACIRRLPMNSRDGASSLLLYLPVTSPWSRSCAIKTNRRCQVLDKHYEPIPGLYAAGELTGIAGGHINGKAGLEGTMLGPALFSGRVAGAWAAYEAGYGKGFAGTPDQWS